MSAASHPSGGAADERELVTALAEVVLEEAAPEELAVFPEAVGQYYDDPEGAVQATSREEAVGFGLALTLLTPYVLAVLGPVVRFLAATVQEAVQDELQESTTALVRRLFRRPAGDRPDTDKAPSLSAEQAREVHAVALERARALGLELPRAELLADAVVGGLVVAHV